MNAWVNQIGRKVNSLKIDKFTEKSEKDLLSSIAGKAWQELATYAGGVAIVRQYMALTGRVLGALGGVDGFRDEVFTLDNEIRPEFVQMVRDTIYDVWDANPIQWNRNVQTGDLDVAGALIERSLGVLTVMHDRGKADPINNLGERAKIRGQVSLLKNAGDKTYQLENQCGAVFRQLQKLNVSHKDAKTWTVASNLISRSRVIARMHRESPDVLERIIKMGGDHGLIIQDGITATGGEKYRFRSAGMLDEIENFKGDVLRSIYNVGNDRFF